MKPFQEGMALIEAEMLNRLNQRGAQNSKVPGGIFFKKQYTSTKVVDKERFLDHVFATRDYDLLTQAIASSGVKAYLERNKDEPPPGVEVTHGYKIQCNKQ